MKIENKSTVRHDLIKGKYLSNQQYDVAYLVLIDRHLYEVRESLDLVKAELSQATNKAVIDKHAKILEELLAELNIMEQYRKEVDAGSKV